MEPSYQELGEALTLANENTTRALRALDEARAERDALREQLAELRASTLADALAHARRLTAAL